MPSLKLDPGREKKEKYLGTYTPNYCRSKGQLKQNQWIFVVVLPPYFLDGRVRMSS